jgi:hypothetical protein
MHKQNFQHKLSIEVAKTAAVAAEAATAAPAAVLTDLACMCACICVYVQNDCEIETIKCKIMRWRKVDIYHLSVARDSR